MRETRPAAPSEKRTRRAAEIVAVLEKQILSGDLAPGQRVDENAIALQFGVSRTPVREAVMELAATGLIEQRAHRGSFIASITLEEIFDVYEVLTELEGLCARLATRRMDASERATLQQLHVQMGTLLAPEDRDRYIKLDQQFHGMLIHAARNEALKEHIALCMRRIGPLRHTSMEMVRNIESAYAEHDKLVAAVAAGHSDVAERIMIEHVALRAEQARDLVARWKTRGARTE